MAETYQLDPLLKGGHTMGSLRALKAFLGENEGTFEKFVVPCAGNFAAVQTIVNAGIDPNKISCSDISIYSSVIGYVCDPSKKVSELEFQALAPTLVELLTQGPTIDVSEDVAEGARILYAVKWCQLQSDKEYIRYQQLELQESAIQIMNAYASTLHSLEALLGGLSYEIRDAHPHIQAEVEKASTLLLYRPPGYSAGYPKLFASGGAFKWNEPSFPPIKAKEVGPFVAALTNASACALLYIPEGAAYDDLPAAQWAALYAELNAKTMKRTYLLSNRESQVSVTNRRKFRREPENIPPVYDDHEITEDCKISFVKTDMDTSLYFYDLFVRDLGMVKAEVYYVFCIDGQVAGALGFDIRTYITTRQPRLYETFGLSIMSERYARIGRLLMAAMCSQEFVSQFMRDNCGKDLLLPPLEEIQTTCLTKYHEAKKNRGILKLVGREEMDNGRFHLVYRTPVHKTDFKECLAAWLKKHAGYGRVSKGGTTV